LDLKIVWSTVKGDLPALQEKIDGLLGRRGQDAPLA